MTKQELIATIAEKCDVSKATAEKVLAAFVATTIEEVAKKGAVRLVGFGTFSARERAARQGRNPQTGAKLKIAAATVPAFKAGKAFKAAVNPAPKKKGGKNK